MATVVSVDTSALMLPVELDIRLFEELERLLDDVDPIVAPAVVAELEQHAADGGQAGRAGSVGHDLALEHCRIVETSAHVADDAVLELAVEGPAQAVVTADQQLIDRALAVGVSAIHPRQHRQLAIRHP